MAGVRAGAFQTYRVVVAVFFAACVVQIFLAGRGVFGIRTSATHLKPGEFFDHQKSLDPHRALGGILSLVAVLLLLLVLVAWNKAVLPWVFLLAVLALVVQHLTAAPAHPWGAAFHPISGVLILGISGWLTRRAWRGSQRPLI
jgi:hypothetical protein